MKHNVPLIFCMLHFDHGLTKIWQEKFHRKKYEDHRNLGLQFSFNRTEIANVYQQQIKGERAQRKTNV